MTIKWSRKQIIWQQWGKRMNFIIHKLYRGDEHRTRKMREGQQWKRNTFHADVEHWNEFATALRFVWHDNLIVTYSHHCYLSLLQKWNNFCIQNCIGSQYCELWKCMFPHELNEPSTVSGRKENILSSKLCIWYFAFCFVCIFFFNNFG